MSHNLICWNCGASIAYAILPLSRRETCKQCEAEQHVCRLCKFHAPRVSDQCTEDRAEQVSNKELANFCDYFDPKADAWRPDSETAQHKAANDLAALFGGGAESASDDAASDELKDLFGLNKD